MLRRSAVSLIALLIISTFNAHSEVFIREFTDLVKARENAEWIHKNGSLIALGASELGVLEMRERVINDPRFAGQPTRFLYLEAKPTPGRKDFGAGGSYTYSLPSGQYYQFQGAVELNNGRQNPASVTVQIKTQQSGEWVVDQVFHGKEIGINTREQKGIAFVLDLSPWAGQEVQISLALDANASYINANEKEQWTPATVSCEWGLARVVASSFKVVLGDEEKVNPKGKKLSVNNKI